MAKEIDIRAPYDNSLIKTLPLHDESEVFDALNLAHETFSDRSQWLHKDQRITILEKLVQLMLPQRDQLAKIAASEGGKPLTDSLVEVDRAIQGIKIAIHTLSNFAGKEIPMGLTPSSRNRLALTVKEPIGVAIAISAFNHPLNLIVHQVIPAVAVGVPILVKPAKATPLSCLKLIELLRQAGLPKAWCQPMVCENTITEKVVADVRTRFMSFIGSATVGWHLRSMLSPGASCALEHGGVAPVIVEKDADIEKMIPALIKGGYYHAGQVCVSVQRVYLHCDIAKNVANKMRDAVEQLTVGNPLDADTDVGPLISPLDVDRIEQWVNQAKAAGAEILSGGKRISDYCFEPTLVLNPPDDVKLSTHEVFGPVVCLYTVKDRNEAIARANALPFSFQAAVYTQNINAALNIADALKADAVMINDHTAFRVDWMPFGGSEESGLGKGGIPHSMNDMTKDKLIIINRT